MKMLVCITDAVWISPDDLVAVVDLGGKTMILLANVEPIVVHHISPDDVLDKVQAALHEASEILGEDQP